MTPAEVLALYEEQFALVASSASEDRKRAAYFQAEAEKELPRFEAAVEAAKVVLATTTDAAAQVAAAMRLGEEEGRLAVLRRRHGEFAARVTAESPRTIEFYAWQGVRSKVHEALQLQAAPPGGDGSDDTEFLSALQKRHFTSLWQEADRLVLATGITPTGRVTP